MPVLLGDIVTLSTVSGSSFPSCHCTLSVSVLIIKWGGGGLRATSEALPNNITGSSKYMRIQSAHQLDKAALPQQLFKPGPYLTTFKQQTDSLIRSKITLTVWLIANVVSDRLIAMQVALVLAVATSNRC
jgi:hypothetical protein